MRTVISLIFLFILTIIFVLSFAQTTPQFNHQQKYLFDPCTTGVGPIGVGAWNVWHLPGAFGEGVSLVDVEQGWNLLHEDLPGGIDLIFGNPNPNEWDHGTSVLGIIAGQHNDYGIHGFCPNLDSIGIASRYIEGNPFPDSAEYDQIITNAISQARQYLNAGDIILLEC